MVHYIALWWISEHYIKYSICLYLEALDFPQAISATASWTDPSGLCAVSKCSLFFVVVVDCFQSSHFFLSYLFRQFCSFLRVLPTLFSSCTQYIFNPLNILTFKLDLLIFNDGWWFSTTSFNIDIVTLNFNPSSICVDRILLQQHVQNLLWRLNHTVAAEVDAQGALDLSKGVGVGGTWDHPSKNHFNTAGPDKSTAWAA